MNAPPALRMKGIHVRYKDLEVLREVELEVRRGEIHAVVGAHRAGKTTLVKLLCGLARPSRGTIEINGREVQNLTPKTSLQHKIGIIHQDPTLIGSLNAVENICAGLVTTPWYGRMRTLQMVRRTQEILAELGVSLDLRVPVRHLAKADQHMVELARLVMIDPDILVFDEISGKLTPDEMELVYKLLFKYRNLGRGIIYISHNMDEIFQFSDRVTILHDGTLRGTEEIGNIDKAKLINLTYSFVLSREELQQANIELYNFKRYNEDIIRNLPIGVIILDKDRKVYMANTAAVQILAIKDADGLGISELLSRFDPQVSADLSGRFDIPGTHVLDEVPYDGDRQLKLTVFPFGSEWLEGMGTIVLIEDISFEISMKNYLVRTEKVSSIAELAAGVAHEINNPLGIILNYVEILKRRRLEDDAVSNLREMEEELHRIVDIVGSLLSFSKARDWQMEELDLPSVLDEVLILVKHKTAEKGVRLGKAGTWREARVLGNWNRLKQLFLNLLINAVEAVCPGGSVELAESIDQERTYVEISVSDDGCGILPEISERIFDPFFSTKNTPHNTGLGLSICQHIVESHMGLISVKSGGGVTTFSVRLPLV